MDSNDSFARLASSKRILVVGSSGSGKTTFSIRLGRILDIETIHLDAHFWKPGWIATEQSEWRAMVASLIKSESWIMDGTYESTLDLRIPAADCIVLVESSRWACIWRVLKRKATVDDQQRPDAPAGQKIDRAFLRYIWRYPVVTHPFVSTVSSNTARKRQSFGSKDCPRSKVVCDRLKPMRGGAVRRRVCPRRGRKSGRRGALGHQIQKLFPSLIAFRLGLDETQNRIESINCLDPVGQLSRPLRRVGPLPVLGCPRIVLGGLERA